MKIISNKKRNRWSIFCIIAGLFSVYASIMYVVSMNGTFGGGHPYLDFSRFYNLSLIELYFFANSILLIVLGLFLNFNKKANLYNILSIILFIFVFVGWILIIMKFDDIVVSKIIFGNPQLEIASIVTIPLFNIAIIGSFVSSVKRLHGKLKYEDEVNLIQNT